jgi:hypothetical protein
LHSFHSPVGSSCPREQVPTTISGILFVWKGYIGLITWVNAKTWLSTSNNNLTNYCSGEDEVMEEDFQEFQEYDEF